MTDEQRHLAYARYGFRRAGCGRTVELTLDHGVPFAFEVQENYGDDEPVTRCRRCNSRKGARGLA